MYRYSSAVGKLPTIYLHPATAAAHHDCKELLFASILP
jgi:hypothetical protein